ncbi:MAG: carbohydrate kinase family protein [Streptosporangiaceae bacterium]
MGRVICVLGDAHLDVIVAISGPVAPDTDTPAETRVAVGGQAANVAAWVCELGGRSRLITALADDPAAQLVASELAARGVEVVGPVMAGHTGVIVSLSARGADRSMLTDRGVGPLLSEAAIVPEWLDDCSWLHLPAYSLTNEPVHAASLAAAAAARARSAGLSVDLSSTAAIKHYGPAAFAELLRRLKPDLVFGNKAETELIGDVPDAQLITKLGPGGVIAGGKHYPAVSTQPADATGAGDAFAAGYLVGGVHLGLEAAARAVATMGAMP